MSNTLLDAWGERLDTYGEALTFSTLSSSELAKHTAAREVVLTACRQQGYALEYASEDVLAAVAQDGHAKLGTLQET